MFPSSTLVVVKSILSAIACRFVSDVVADVVGLVGGGGARNDGRR